MSPRLIQLNAFEMATPGHIQQGLWRHPRDQASDYTRLDRWIDLARTLERGLFDGLFLADVLGVYDVYAGSVTAALRGGVQVPLLDPAMLVPAMAAATTHLGFTVTSNLTYEPPFLLARRFSTLDHLTNGRVGWNIVTGYLDSAARALGAAQQSPHDDRYDRADAVLDDLYGLWEGSWADDAVKRDRGGGVYADATRVRAVPVGPSGFEAIHLCEPSRQRTPVLFQAGASERGRRFAARHAEGVFINGGAKADVARLVADLRARAAPRPIRVFVGATLVIDRTESAARERLDDYRRSVDVEGAFAHASASLGIDFARFDWDQPIDTGSGNAIQSNVTALRQAGIVTKRQLVDSMVLGSRQAPIVGSAAQVAETLIDWVRDTDVDGFNLSRTVTPEGWTLLVDLLVPALQERGAFKHAYAPGSYRAKLLNAGDRLAAPHPAAAFRFGAAL